VQIAKYQNIKMSNKSLHSYLFDSIVDRVKDNRFLPADSYISADYSGSDTDELFQKNLKIQPGDWLYRTKTVRYTVNDQKYRTMPFKKIDWANSVVIFGCSHTFGVGLDDRDTLSSCLSNIIDMPVINMGVGGSSIMFALHNNLILRDGYPTPKAVINVWTAYDRIVYYHNKYLTNHGSWNANQNCFTEAWVNDPANAKVHALFANKTCRIIWKDTNYLEYSYFKETADLLKCKFMTTQDLARDMMHHGHLTNQLSAEILAKELKL
jgi:hypothetical protein